MNNPNPDNLQKELDNLSSEEKHLLERLRLLQERKSNKEIEQKALIEKMPMTVKVAKVLQKNGQVTDPTFVLENNPVKYHEEYVNLLRTTTGRFYHKTENTNHIPASSLDMP